MSKPGERFDYSKKLKGVSRKKLTLEQSMKLMQSHAAAGCLRTKEKPTAVYVLTDFLLRIAAAIYDDRVSLKTVYHLAALALIRDLNKQLKAKGFPEVDISKIDTPEFHTGRDIHRKRGPDAKARKKRKVGDGGDDVGVGRTRDDEGAAGA